MKILFIIIIIAAVYWFAFRKPKRTPRDGYSLRDPGEPEFRNNHGEVLLFVKIPESITTEERAERYEDPLNEFLTSRKLGAVTGGGSVLNEERGIESIGLDVEVHDPDKAIPNIIRILNELGVPEGTVIEQYEPMERIIKVK
jgi:hypothetical protein